jgi:ParD-like antitoxin of type II bacterial toxin-antitoxin system
MSSMPLRIDGDLINEAKVSGQVFHRSIAQQVEHWASLGRVLEKVLTVSSVGKMKSLNRPVDLERVLAGARSAAGKKKTLALLAGKKGPLYGTKPDRPGVVLQYHPDGTVVAGEMIKSEFVRAKRASKAKSGR